jgi:hypothetical protein
MSAANDPTLDAVLAEVRHERERQDAKWGPHFEQYPSVAVGDDGRPFTPHSYGLPRADDARALCDRECARGNQSFVAIACEELAEALEAASQEHGGDDEERTEGEVIQLAAVAVKWAQAIRRRRAAKAGTR